MRALLLLPWLVLPLLLPGAPAAGALPIGGSAALGLAGFLATEWGRFKILSWMAFLPLFTRLEKDDVLAHGTREQLYPPSATPRGRRSATCNAPSN